MGDMLTRAESHSTGKSPAPRSDAHAPICITDIKATEKTNTKMER
jgi:hypothetical protein